MRFHTTRQWVPALHLAAALCAPFAVAAAQPIKVGWLSSLTGPLSAAAQAENKGVQLAVEEINKAGGVNGRRIELLPRDTAGDPTQAVNFAQQLAFSDKVHFVIGSIDELIDPKKFPRAFRVINTNRRQGDLLQRVFLGGHQPAAQEAVA